MKSDWHPGRVTREYRDNYSRIFKGGSGGEEEKTDTDCGQVGGRSSMSEVSKTRCE